MALEQGTSSIDGCFWMFFQSKPPLPITHGAPSRIAAAPRRNTQAPCSEAIRPCPAVSHSWRQHVLKKQRVIKLPSGKLT